MKFDVLIVGGSVAVGAMTILSSVMQMSMLPIQGLTQGAQPIIGFNYGAKKMDRVKKTFRLLLLSCVTFTAVIWLICMLLPQAFILIFTDQAELIAFTKWAMRIYMAVSMLLSMLRIRPFVMLRRRNK